jgi:flagellar assembly factor FliW
MIPENAVIGEDGAIPPGAPATVDRRDPSKIEIDTRFGLIEFGSEHAIYMPRGMMGFADKKNFGLVQLADPRMENFVLLQSLTEPELSFILMPLDPANPMIEQRDIDTVREGLSIEAGDLAVLMVVSIRNIDGLAQVSVNMRAPVFIDVGNRSAWQHVLSNGRYPIRYILQSEEAVKSSGQ